MNWKFKHDAEPAAVDALWDGLNEGYIKPEELLAEGEQIDALKAAVNLINSFFDAGETNGTIEIF